MSIITTLEIDDYSFNVLEFRHSLETPVHRNTSVPSGMLEDSWEVVIDYPRKDIFFSWMFEPLGTRQLKLIQSSVRLNGKSRIFELYDVYCTHTSTHFIATNNIPMTLKIGFQPGIVVLDGCKIIEKPWKITELSSVAPTRIEKEDNKEKDTLVTRVKGPKELFLNEEGTYQVTSFNQDATQIEKENIKWALKIDDKIVNLEEKGEELNYKPNNSELVGKTILVIPYLEEYDEKIAVTTIIKQVELPIFIDRYKLKGKILKNGVISKADDMHYGDGINMNTGNALYSKKRMEGYGMLMKATMLQSEESLWEGFTIMVKKLFAWGELDSVVLKMISHFRSNKGTDFTDSILTKHAKSHPSTQRFCKSMEQLITQRLKKSKGLLDKIENNSVDWVGDTDWGHPRFKYGKDGMGGMKGLTIAINDIWAYEVTLVKYEEHNKKFNATYKVKLYDNFGLDEPDLEKKYYYLLGFRAWFLLQHLYNYKPFITVIEFEQTFKGSY